jgi:hypothetical protein
MSLVLAWVCFPLVMAALGWGWGTLIERVFRIGVSDALLIPLGLAATLVVAGTVTAWPKIAPAAVTVCAIGAVAGLALAVRHRRTISPWPLLVAVAVLLVYGAPVLLTGEATFAGVIKLDDTATWFNFIDNAMSHGRSTAGLPPSTYKLNFEQINPAYPLGAFMLPGVARALTGIDMAWVFQPYLASCAAALSVVLYGLLEPILASPRLRALVAFVAAQPALLYAYSLWSGIKEMAAAFLLALGVALIAGLIERGSRRPRELVPVAIAAGGLMQTLSIGAGAWMAPAMVVLAGAWLWPGLLRAGTQARETAARARASLAARTGGAAASMAALAAMTLACVVPVLVVLASFLGKQDENLFSSGQDAHTRLGNLLGPLKAAQLAGIWPMGDFRRVAPLTPTAILIGIELAAALWAMWWCLRRRRVGVPLYVAIALAGCAIFYLVGATPWVVAKSLAICSPALLTAGLAGAALLWSRRAAPLPRIAGAAPSGTELADPPQPPPRGGGSPQPRGTAPRRGGLAGLLGGGGLVRVAGLLAGGAIAGGAIWSNVLAYGSASLAPRPRMAELAHIGQLVAGKGPTLINEYEVYADRHFLRDGAPVEPAEYRPVTLPLRNGSVLTKSAWASMNAFSLSTLMPYRSIVTRRVPTESRPPSIWHLAWQGRYYDLWQRPDPAPRTILEQIPYGESNEHPYCGAAENGETQPLCALQPGAYPSCPQLGAFARKASSEHAHLVAYEHAPPTVVHGDEVRWPASWLHEPEAKALVPLTPGTATGQIKVATSQHYELYLGGEFARGFQVSVDGRRVGTLKNELDGFNAYAPVASVYLTAGVHAFSYTYPHSGLAPGSAENTLTALSGVALEPLDYPQAQIVSVSPAQYSQLCGNYLDWVEIVAGP